MNQFVRWPPLLRPSKANWVLTARTKSGGVALNGMEQIVGSPDDLWIGTYEFVIGGDNIGLPKKARLWRGLEAVLAGRTRFVVIPTFDVYQLAGGCDGQGSLAHSDGTFHSDGTGYSGHALMTCVAEDAPVMSSYVISYNHASITPEAGVTITIGGWLHTVRRVIPMGGSRHKLEVRPSVRFGVRRGARIIYKPMVLARLGAGDSFVRSMETVRSGSGKLILEEVIDRRGISF